MKTKRILASLLCIAMLMALMPTVIFADSATDEATAAWLNESGNKLYVGAIEVTAANAANIITSYSGEDITGNASFKVEDGVPTLCLNDVTIKDGYKYSEFNGDWYYEIYGIYYKSASNDKLTIKLSGTNVIEPKDYNDDDHPGSSETYGIITEGACTELMLEGGENSSLKVASEENALAVYNGVDYDDWGNCVISINGGEYEFKTDKGEKYSGEAIFCRGSLKIENAKVNVSSKSNRGIWTNTVGRNLAKGDEVTSIKNSNVTINAGTGKSWCDGIYSYGNIVIESSTVDITCDENGLIAKDGKSITVSGADTVVSVKSRAPVDESGWAESYAAILTEKPLDSSGEDGEIPSVGEISLNDGLAVTTPDAGRIGGYDFDRLTPKDDGFASNKTIFDTDGQYAREVVIKAPTVHYVCGETDCTSHTGTIKHIADNSLNLIKDITTSGATLTGGSYYLSGDLEVNGAGELNVSGNVNICLNGHTLETKIIPKEGAVLNICDCDSNGKGTITNPIGHTIFFNYKDAVVNVYGGTLLSSVDGANTVVDAEDCTGVNTLNLYGGTVKYSGSDKSTAIGSRKFTLNLYGGKVIAEKSNGIVAENGKVNLLGNTEISVPNDYNDIKVYKKELIDASGYKGGSIRILCDGLSDRDIVVKNVTDETTGKFTLSDQNKNSGYILKRVGNDLVYTAVYTVSFDSNGGSGTMASVGGVRGAYELPECEYTAPAGKMFKAWDVDGTEYAPNTTVDISKNTTIKAAWIDKSDVPIDRAIQEKEYDGNAKSFEVKSSVKDGFTVKYQKDGADIASPTDAGSYDVNITRAADDRFAECNVTINGGLVITPKDITGASVGAFSPMTYNGSAQTPQATVTVGGLTATGVWSNVTNVADKTTFTADGNFKGTIADKSTGMAKVQQSALTAVEAVNETVKGKADGKITGTDSTMEYKADGASEYTAVVGNEITNLSVGTYKVRYKESDNYLAGADKTIEIAAGSMITVSFNSNGGTAVDSVTCEYNQTITEPAAEPTKEGYEFTGWFADEAFTDAWNFETDKVTESKTLYAKWVQGVVSDEEGSVAEVTADGLNDIAKAEKTNVSLVVQVQEAAEGNENQTAIKSVANAPKNFGFYDIAIKKSTGGTVAEVPSVIEIKLPYDFTRKTNVKVYRYHGGSAQELTKLAERDTVKPYEDGTCFVDAENGCIYIYSAKFSTYSIAYDEIISRRSGSSGSGSKTTDYTVTFNSNGGSKTASQTVNKNSVIKEPTAPTKEGFDFAGWYTDKELITKYDFSAKVTSDFTLYAAWTEKTDAENRFILTIGENDADVFGVIKTNDVAPKIVKDRTMLPARFVAENLGAAVDWNEKDELVTITGKNLKTGEDVTILIYIDSDIAYVNEKEVKLDSPAFIENDRTYTPIRFISEELGAGVDWVESEQKVIITK